MNYSRDPFDVHAEDRDRRDVLSNTSIGKEHARQVNVSIGYQELSDLLHREFRSEWSKRFGDDFLPLADRVLSEAIASSLVEMRDVRVLAIEGEAREQRSPDKAEGSFPSAAPSASLLSRFWKRVTRSPWL